MYINKLILSVLNYPVEQCLSTYHNLNCEIYFLIFLYLCWILSNASFLLNMYDTLVKRNIIAKTQLACIILLCPGQGSHITKSVLDSAGPGGNI